MGIRMKLSKRRRSGIAGLKRDIFSYRYIKRNIIIVLTVAVSATGLGTVIKYGEALDHDQTYVEVMTEDVVVTEETTEESTQVEVAESENASIEAHDNDIVADAGEESEFDGKFVAVVSSVLNVRAEADSESEIVGKLFDGNIGDILDETGEWTKISSGDVIGYVRSEYILTGKDAEEYISAEGGYEYAMSIDEYNAMIAAEVAEAATEEAEVSTQVASADSSTEAAQTSEQTTSSSDSSSRVTETTTESGSSSDTSSDDTSDGSAVDASEYSDSYLLACLVSMEAGYESYEGQLAVANVVLNRVNSGKWGSSVYSVIYAANQFPSVTGSVMQSYLKNGPLESAQKAANEALAGNNNIGSYMFFLNVNYVDTDSLSDYVIIGNHCFY